MRAMRILGSLLASLLTLLLLLAGLVYYLAGTESGLQFAGQLLQSQLGDHVTLGRLRGRLASNIEVDDLRIQIDGDVYSIQHLQLDWSPLALLTRELRIGQLHAESINVVINAPTESDDTEFAIDIDLPVTITLADSSIRSLSIEGLSDEPIVFDQVTLSARTEQQQLQIDTLQITAASYRAGLAGTLGLQPDSTSELQLDWRIDTAGDTPFSATGQAQIGGLLHAYHLQGESSLSGKDIPAGHWQFSAEGTLDGLSIQQLTGQTLDGSVSGSGRLDWLTNFAWELAVDIKAVNPAKHWSEWPGTLSTRLVSSGRLVDDGTQLLLQLTQLQGQLRGYPVSGQVNVNLDNERLDIRQLNIRSGVNQLTASGTLEKSWDITAMAKLPDITALLPGWEGAFDLSGHIKGERDQPRFDVTFSGKQLSGPALAIEALAGDVQLHWLESGQQSATIKMQSAELAGQTYSSATLDFSGSVHRHQLTLIAAGKESAIDLQLAGNWLDTVWQGEIRTADWSYPGTGRWSLQQPVAAQLGPQLVQLPEICWRQGSARLCMDAQGNPGKQLSPNVRLSSFPLSTLAALSGSPLTFTSLVDASLTARLDAGRLTRSDLQVDLGAGSVSYNDPMMPSESQIRKGMLRALLNDDGLTANAALNLGGIDYLGANLSLPGYQAGITHWKQQGMALDINGELHDLLMVKFLLEEVGSFEGSVVLNLKGEGTLGQPQLSGYASITDSTLEIDNLGVRLTDLDLQLQSKVDGIVITGNCDSGKGSVQLNGDVNIVDIAHWQADVRLQGKDFEIMHLPEAVIEVSPDLQASITPPKIALSGEMHVPYARLRPKNLKSRAGVSSDVIIVDAQQVSEPEEERWQVSSNIRLSLGNDVTIDGYGLKGDILGSVDLLDKPGQVTTAQGNLSIDRGSYEVYGRKLDIDRGQLLFSGGPVDNPGLDFEAARRIGDITAGIRGKGTLREPVLTLYSDPSMADSDIISYIAFGKPQAEAGQGGGSATDAGLVAGGNMLAGVLGTAVGLEELGVESGETLNDAAMVLGTYLSPKLYVRYRTGLYDAINEFEVRYEFTRRWSVRTITSMETSSAEIQFSFER